MSLSALQQHMMGYLQDNAAGKTSKHLEPLQQLIHSDSPAAGLQIYGHAYSSRLIEVLQSDHEKLHQFLGEQAFTALAAQYVVEHPSQVRSLRYFGDQFPEFLRRSDHPEARLLNELCGFERLLMTAYDAPAAAQVAHQALAELPPEHWPSLVLQAHSSLRLFADTTGAVPTWQRCNQPVNTDEPVPDLAYRAQENEEALWVVWRDRDRICQFRNLHPAEQIALRSMLADNNTLAATAELLMDALPAERLATDLKQWLDRWFDDGLVSSLASD